MAGKNTEFVVNAYRHDPLKAFRYRVKFDGNKVVAGISKVSALKQSTDIVKHRNGNDPITQRLTPGNWKFEPVTMERGITFDLEFENWAKLVWNVEGDAAISLANFRKNITIDLMNEQGVVAKSYHLYNCWVSEYQALPELDSNGNAIAIEHLVLQYEGFERDVAIVEQAQT